MSRSLLCGYIYQINYSNVFTSGFKHGLPNKHVLKQCKHHSGKIFLKKLSYSSNCTPIGYVYKQNGFNNFKFMSTVANKYVPFVDFLKSRKDEAKRSIIVQVQSAHSFKELHAYCNQFGTINNMFHYTSGVEQLHFIVVEFANETDALNILNRCCHIDDNTAIPVKSPFLWFRLSNSKKITLNVSKNCKLDIENGNKIPTNETILELLKSAKNISSQMRILYESTKLNDLGIRLRFLTARQIESALLGMFPDVVAYPFGSSINGYGKLGCDLDLVLKLDGQNTEIDESRLVYQCKAGLGNERSQSQRHMEAIGDLLHLFLPGCAQVRRILQARVPILKYNQQFTDVECDLSMTNMNALHMSELLYLFGAIDDRVRPLVFTIRRWALEVGLTNSSPGRWITNFSLTLLVLAFLQRTPTVVPLLPSINTLTKLSGKTTDNPENTVNYFKFLDITRLQSSNTETLENLLLQFFEYYSNFDFVSKAISLNEATAITKPEHSALHIVNPLERGLNVSKNVSLEELERLKIELRNAAWLLESQEIKEKKLGRWGILSVLDKKTKKNFYVTSARQNRMMNVKNLFEENDVDNHITDKTEEGTDYTSVEIIKHFENNKTSQERTLSSRKLKALTKNNAVNVKRR